MQSHVSDARALASLLSLSEWNVEVGREVVAALAALGERAVPELADVLQDAAHSRVARMAAAWLLGRLGDTRATRVLCRAQGDADGEVASAANRALNHLERQPCSEALTAA
jgi:HEAT repeat protein